VYCVIALSFISCLNLSSLFYRFSVEVYFLTCGIRAWFENLGSELNPRSSKSHKSEIFKVVLERMASSSRIEIKKFNGQNFELWKLKIEYLLVDQEQWETVLSRYHSDRYVEGRMGETQRRERSTI
jgi:hypothetical protein